MDNKAKDGVSVIMDPQDRCVLYSMIPKFSHMFHQFPDINDPGLFESIHTLFNVHVDLPLVVYQCSEVVHINDLLWDYFQWNAYKFRVW